MEEVKEFVEWLTARSDIEQIHLNGFSSSNGEYYTIDYVLKLFELQKELVN